MATLIFVVMAIIALALIFERPGPSEPELAPVEAFEEGEFIVSRVIDGDTIEVEYNGKPTSLRLIGVDTPESVDPRRPVQCFGVESHDYLKAKLEGKAVRLSKDPTQNDRDKYDRLLRYVYLGDEDVANSIIRDGYGHEYTYISPHLHKEKYEASERHAETNVRGLWAPGACADNQ